MRTEYRILAGILRDTDGGHALHAVNQLRYHLAKTMLDCEQIGLALTHCAIHHRSHQRVLIQLEISENFRHLKPGQKTIGAVCPNVLRRNGGTLQFASPLAGLA